MSVTSTAPSPVRSIRPISAREELCRQGMANDVATMTSTIPARALRMETETPFCDPACGTGGFLLIAHEFIRNHNKLDKKQLTFLNTEQLRGVELVNSVARLCCMSLVLHGIGSDATHVPVMVKDAVAGKHGGNERVMTNRQFGTNSSVIIVNAAGCEQR